MTDNGVLLFMSGSCFHTENQVLGCALMAHRRNDASSQWRKPLRWSCLQLALVQVSVGVGMHGIPKFVATKWSDRRGRRTLDGHWDGHAGDPNRMGMDKVHGGDGKHLAQPGWGSGSHLGWK